MDQRDEHIKRILVWFIVVIWFFPLVQSRLHLFEERMLHGAIEKNYNPIFIEKSWFEGRYQNFKEEYLNAQFGFRPFFIRLHNQLEFLLFGKVHAKYVVRGKEDYWFEYNYIKTYYGRDFIGDEKVSHRMKQMKAIQDSLARQYKTFIFVITASKGQFYPEYFPDSCQYPFTRTNYQAYSEQAKELGINFIDFNPPFQKLKNTSKHPLYTKNGIHWTYYGACLAADSLIHFIEKKRKIDLPELSWNSIKQELARNEDRDIELVLNFLFPFKQQVLSYPEVYYQKSAIEHKPSVMVIGDSYYWSLYNLEIFNAFSKHQFWYYYYNIYESQVNGTVIATDSILKKALRDFDVVILLGTDVNLYNLGWGFIESSGKVLENEAITTIDFGQKVQNLIAYIKTDSSWYKEIINKATINRISVDSMLTLDAIWITNQNEKK